MFSCADIQAPPYIKLRPDICAAFSKKYDCKVLGALSARSPADGQPQDRTSSVTWVRPVAEVAAACWSK